MRFIDLRSWDQSRLNNLETINRLISAVKREEISFVIKKSQSLWLPTEESYNIETEESLLLKDYDNYKAGELKQEDDDVEVDEDFLISKEPLTVSEVDAPIVSTVTEEAEDIKDLDINEAIRELLFFYTDFIPNMLPTTLTDQQYLACLFFLLFDSIKAFLLNHGTGVGKTVEGSFITTSFLNLSPSSRVIILVLNVTKKQWEAQLTKDNGMDHRIDLISYDTSTFGNSFSLARSKIRNSDRVLVIIDEMHIMISRSIPKMGKKNRTMKAYLDTILDITQRKNNKLLMLTGTPFINTIREFEEYLRILRPSIFKQVQPSEIITLDVLKRTREISEILRYSISSLNPQLKFAFSNSERTDDYASKKVIFRRIEMHSYQEELYNLAAEVERKSGAGGFRSLTRNYGNFAYKLYVRENMTEEEYYKKREETMEEFTSIMRSNIPLSDKEELMTQCSTEFKDIVDHIKSEESKQLKGLIYINMMENIDAMKAYLEVRGISHFEFSGRTLKTRQADLDVFNSESNINGEMIRIMILSAAGSIGINIVGARVIYFLSQEWNDATAQQVIGRCLRYRYHIMFPPEEREVRIFLYFSVIKSHHTTDDAMFSILKRKFNILSQASSIFLDSSIEKFQEPILIANRVTPQTSNKTKLLTKVNNFLSRKYDSYLSGKAYTKEVMTKKILYRLGDDILDGFIADGKIYNSSMVEIAKVVDTKIIIDGQRLIYQL